MQKLFFYLTKITLSYLVSLHKLNLYGILRILYWNLNNACFKPFNFYELKLEFDYLETLKFMFNLLDML
jgi:hypothetical protein